MASKKAPQIQRDFICEISDKNHESDGVVETRLITNTFLMLRFMASDGIWRKQKGKILVSG